MPTRILIADDHKIFREGLRTLLQNRGDIEVIGEADNGRSVVGLAAELRPDIVIMDVAMPDLNGIEATRQIMGARSPAKVLALSMHSDSRFVTRMLQAGAQGYLLKDCAFEELALAIDTIVGDGVYLSPGVTGVVVRDYVQHLAEGDGGIAALSPREREVLQLVAEGLTTKDIAGKLHISVKTVETHRKQIMDKLEIRSVAELTKYAVREGLTSLDVSGRSPPTRGFP
jgi:two-component system, NarL family, response regulator NreC